MYLVYQFEASEDPKSLADALWQHKVTHQIVFEKGHNQLWIFDQSQLGVVEQLINIWKDDPSLLATIQSNPSPKTKNSLFIQIKGSPVTSGLLLLTLLVAIITQLGADLTLTGYFAISPFDIKNGHIYFYDLPYVLDKHQYWRLFTPTLLHFSVLHIVFNTLWVWEVGSKLERILGSISWSIGVLVVAVLSNVLQYKLSNYPLFGGLSGVVYGLIGFAWLMPILSRRWPIIISKQLMLFFIVWLGIGYTPLPEMLGLGNIANTAHLIGLLSGLVLGGVYWLINKYRFSR